MDTVKCDSLLNQIKSDIETINNSFLDINKEVKKVHWTEQLKKDISHKETEAVDVVNKINEFLRYLNSSKFNCGNNLDGYVNTDDVRRFLHEIKLQVSDIGY